MSTYLRFHAAGIAYRSIHPAFTEPYRSSATIRRWDASAKLPDKGE